MARFFNGQGKVYAALRDGAGAPGAFRYLGNTRDLSVAPGAGFDVEADLVDQGGVLQPFADDGEQTSFAMTLDDLARENLAWAVRGRSGTVAGAAVAAEAMTARKGGFNAFANINLTAVNWVKNAAESVTYTPGTDYIADTAGSGIEIPTTSAIPDASAIKANYNHGAYERIAAFTDAAPYLWVRVHGINTVDRKRFVADFYKARLAPVGDVPLIGDALVALRINGRAFFDTVQGDDADNGRVFRLRFA